eukprot:CAMPEP_0203755186 /NCGR_PEP_ID=MMETSP0098-20131031/8677_1 /ASSEMBLY_ACC=CAM_ASM_000208 /TAXON_ID=96639 /ORGANISM=" , Strain NY0313808BC1" /LENGTH=657 /DNA_ID=CAMNT_0050646543 /DNA_START=81 /DNA_END=2051 /DNA_ORIENTATION=+
MPKKLIHSVSVAEFDELKGNCISYVFPSNPKPPITSHQPQDIAELCLPDGGHKRSCDSIYILLSGEGDKPLYGYAYFRNKADTSEKRGARQVAILIVASVPYFDRFRPFLTVAIEEYLSQGESVEVIHSLYDALEQSYRKTKELALKRLETPELQGQSTTHIDHSNGSRRGLLNNPSTCTLHLWDRMFVMQPLEPLQDNEFGGISLRDLVVSFRAQTMSIWLAMMSLKRVLFCGPGNQAESVGNAVLATPLLLGPLGMLVVPNLVPYVTLANVDPVTKHGSYICGATNDIFCTKTMWYDIAANPKTGKVMISPESNMDRSMVKVQGADLAFINRVIDGIENGKRDEQWVRYEFAAFTQEFLDTVREIELEKVFKRTHEHHSVPSTETQKKTFLPKHVSISVSSPSKKMVPTHRASVSDTNVSSLLECDRRNPRKKNPVKWQQKVKTPFIKRKTPSEKLTETFTGTTLWLRYRWLQLNPESFNSTANRKRLSRIHAIQLEETSSQAPPVPKRPQGWEESRSNGSIRATNSASSRPSSACSSRSQVVSVLSVSSGSSTDTTDRHSSKWKTARTKDGQVYYWHVDTKETTWSLSSTQSLAADSDSTSEDPTSESPTRQTKWEFAQGRWQNRKSHTQYALKPSFSNNWVEATTENGERYFW